MLQDVSRRARTEIDAINGAVVREGRRVDVATPVNETLTELVQGLDGAHSARHGERPMRERLEWAACVGARAPVLRTMEA